jgi:peptide/nickel transport system permease protein
MPDGSMETQLSPATGASAPQVLEGQLRRRAENWWTSPYGRSARKLLRNHAAMFASAVLVGIVLMALAAEQIAPYDPLAIAADRALQPPSARHWFGTDQFGRDILSRVIFGSRLSVPLGFIPVLIGASLGTSLGLVAGYLEGVPRRIIMRAVDVMLGFPLFLLALFIVAMLGPSLLNAMLAVGISSTPAYARVVYSSVLSIRERDFIVAARALGVSEFAILGRHVLPNVLAPVLVVGTIGLAYAILTGAALSFLGLGAAPPTPEWGAMVYAGRDYLRSYWWIATLPGLMIMLAVLAVNVLGDGLRDALDPRSLA